MDWGHQQHTGITHLPRPQGLNTLLIIFWLSASDSLIQPWILSEMTHGKCCLLSPLTYTKDCLGQLRNASFSIELFSWKLVFWSCPQYSLLFSCWLAPKIIANFSERETFRGEYRHSVEEKIMPTPPDCAKACIQPPGYSVNFFLAGYWNLTQVCSALVLTWPWKPWQSVNIPVLMDLFCSSLKQEN